MENRTTTDPDSALERTGDELEERLETLDDHIGEARDEAKARHEDADPSGDNGDWDEDDDGGSDDADFDDPEAEDEEEDE
jgi:hypothetical protein